MPREDYEKRQEAKKERYEDLAEQKAREAEALNNQASKMANVIPFGQPILVGHHSERRDRNYRNKIHDKFVKASETADTAQHYAGKAASVGKGGISSDDPQAIVKLKEELAECQSLQEKMKAANKIVRKYRNTETPEAIEQLMAIGLSESSAKKAFEKDFAGRYGFPDYAITNNGANIRRIQKRIEHLEQEFKREDKTIEHENIGLRIEHNTSENRVQLFFAERTSKEFYGTIRTYGFVWSKENQAFQRQLNNAGIYAAERIAELYREANKKTAPNAGD